MVQSLSNRGNMIRAVVEQVVTPLAAASMCPLAKTRVKCQQGTFLYDIKLKQYKYVYMCRHTRIYLFCASTDRWLLLQSGLLAWRRKLSRRWLSTWRATPKRLTLQSAVMVLAKTNSHQPRSFVACTTRITRSLYSSTKTVPSQ